MAGIISKSLAYAYASAKQADSSLADGYALAKQADQSLKISLSYRRFSSEQTVSSRNTHFTTYSIINYTKYHHHKESPLQRRAFLYAVIFNSKTSFC